MFSFPDNDVDFYLPQLVLMYIQLHDVTEVLYPYLVHRWTNSLNSSDDFYIQFESWIIHSRIKIELKRILNNLNDCE